MLSVSYFAIHEDQFILKFSTLEVNLRSVNMLHIRHYYMQIFSFQKGSQFLKATLMSNDVPLFSSFISILIITTDARSLSLNKLAVFMIKLITFQQQPSLSSQIFGSAMYPK